ncbi:hypothetical protein K443DRAFT_65461, partial [Laccaria amethystina LaAM-08-1]
WLILHDVRLVWIPLYAVKPLHKTIHETSPTMPVLGDLGLVQIPSHSVKTLPKTVYETVELLWSHLLWSVLRDIGLVQILSHSM